mgnify:CR=1 FL=1
MVSRRELHKAVNSATNMTQAPGLAVVRQQGR